MWHHTGEIAPVHPVFIVPAVHCLRAEHSVGFITVQRFCFSFPLSLSFSRLSFRTTRKMTRLSLHSLLSNPVSMPVTTWFVTPWRQQEFKCTASTILARPCRCWSLACHVEVNLITAHVSCLWYLAAPCHSFEFGVGALAAINSRLSMPLPTLGITYPHDRTQHLVISVLYPVAAVFICLWLS